MKSIDARFYIHKINPLSLLYTVEYAAHSSIESNAIHRCRVLAEEMKGKDFVGFFRVIDTDIRKDRKSVIFLSQVDFDTVTHYDMRERELEPSQDITEMTHHET